MLKIFYFLLAFTLGSLALIPVAIQPAPVAARPPASPAPAQAALDTLADIESLPRLDRTRTVQLASSRDPTDGNTDWGHYLYQENGRYVILDERGPGSIDRIWMAFPTDDLGDKGDIAFYFDGEASPRLKLRLIDLFSGQAAPFLDPLAGNSFTSSGGFYAYVPLPYERSIRVSLSEPPLYWQITYRSLRSDAAIASYTGAEDSGRVREQWSQPGLDPKPTAGNRVLTATILLAPGERWTAADLAGAGSIRALRLRAPPQHLRDIWLDIVWEGETKPGVSAPLGDFFGAAHTPTSVRSLLVGQSPEGDLYCYLPMPFHRSAQVSFRNESPAVAGISFEMEYRLGPETLELSPEIGHLRTEWRDAVPRPEDLDFTVLDVTGRGKFVGLALTMHGPKDENYPGFLEGDEWIYVDGDRSLSLGGTGLEDYFNSAYYFRRRPSTLALHGAPVVTSDPYGFYYSAYRFHLNDAIPFHRSFRFGIEYFPHALRPVRLRSLAYWYGRSEPDLKLTDALDPTDEASLTAHQAGQSGALEVRQVVSSFGARYQREVVTGTVAYQASGHLEFDATVDPKGDGVRLERRMDFGVADQAADIFIDGVYSGRWSTSGRNPFRRWRDARFEIPPEVTQGKDSIQIKIEPVTDWSAGAYRIYSYSVDPAPTPTRSPTPHRHFLPFVARAPGGW